MDQFVTDLGNGEEDATMADGATNLVTLQLIGSGVANLVARGVSDALVAGGRIATEGIRTSAGVVSESVKAMESVGTQLLSSARVLSHGWVTAVGEGAGDGITAWSRVLQIAAKEVADVGSGLTRLAARLAIGVAEAVADVAAAVVPRSRSAT